MIMKWQAVILLLTVINNSLLLKTIRIHHTKCVGGEYTNSGLKRTEVPADKIPWTEEWDQYSPPYFTSPKSKGKSWADSEDVSGNTWNCLEHNVNRISHRGNYTVKDGYPLNPIGRTGLRGRGVLGRWGPNHLADPIVTTWKRENGSRVVDPLTKTPILQFIGMKRRDTGEWALPGGFVDPGESVSNTLKREFLEETMDYLNMTPQEKKDIQITCKGLFSNGYEIYKGYVDDRRNTDNSWTETVATNFHDETGAQVKKLKLKAGDDAVGVKWIDISSDCQLYASQKDFIKLVAALHGASW